MERYYKLCQQHMGKVARITDRNGRVHVGRIERVTNRKVYIRPVGGSRGGFGYGVITEAIMAGVQLMALDSVLLPASH